MQVPARRVFVGMIAVAALTVSWLVAPGSAGAVADHLECYRIKDLRGILPSGPHTLTPELINQFEVENNCTLVRTPAKPKAREVCVAVSKSPAGPPSPGAISIAPSTARMASPSKSSS